MTEAELKSKVAAQIVEIKTHMPETYRSIQAKAYEIGNEAYALVRKGLGGAPNCFYAIERGRVMGAPFNVPGVMADVAKCMVEFGCAYVCIWPIVTKKE